jgi:hypothetical protein
VVLLIDGVVKEDELLCKGDPPVAAAYQSIVSPLPGVAEMVTVPVPHLEAPEPAGATGALTVIEALLIAPHPKLLAAAVAVYVTVPLAEGFAYTNVEAEPLYATVAAASVYNPVTGPQVIAGAEVPLSLKSGLEV